MVKFVLVLFFSALIVSGVSLLWYKFTPRERPATLQTVHDLVTQTQVGKEAARVLGVSDDGATQPLNFSTVASTVAGSMTSAVGNAAQEIVARQITTQIVGQYQHLSQDQQQYIKVAICKP